MAEPEAKQDVVDQLAGLGYGVATPGEILAAAMAAYGLNAHEARNLLYGAPPQILPELPQCRPDLGAADPEESE